VLHRRSSSSIGRLVGALVLFRTVAMSGAKSATLSGCFAAALFVGCRVGCRGLLGTGDWRLASYRRAAMRTSRELAMRLAVPIVWACTFINCTNRVYNIHNITTDSMYIRCYQQFDCGAVYTSLSSSYTTDYPIMASGDRLVYGVVSINKRWRHI